VENIERTQFVVLTGHLDDQPLPELIRRLRVQRKSGRLQVEYRDGPAAFFFEDGQMVDARMGSLRGVEALYAALALEGASFNFNPLVRPPERSIDDQGRRFIEDLADSRGRDGVAEIRTEGRRLDRGEARGLEKVEGGGLERTEGRGLERAEGRGLERTEGRGLDVANAQLHLQQTPRALPSASEITAPLEERLTAVEGAIVSASHRFSRERLLYAVVIGFLVGLSLITTLNVLYGPFFRRSTPVVAAAATQPPAPRPAVAETATSPPNVNTKEPKEPSVAPAPGREAGAQVPSAAAVIGSRRIDGVSEARREYVVEVLVEVKAGVVTDARVWNPRPGAGAYEAVALKMARERRYPSGFTGGERVKIRVKP
jgi:Domain of unknown function (DUF4388)